MTQRIFVQCSGCGWICSAVRVTEDGSEEIRPLGVGDCPDCRASDFEELCAGQDTDWPD